MIRVCPHSDSRCANGIACAFSCATDAYDGTKRPMTPLDTQPGDKGSSPDGDPHRETADRWADLERLAKAAIADNDNPCIFAATQSLADFNEVANPAAILELITAARASSVGTNGEAGSAEKPDRELVEALEFTRDEARRGLAVRPGDAWLVLIEERSERALAQTGNGEGV